MERDHVKVEEERTEVCRTEGGAVRPHSFLLGNAGEE